MNNLHTYIAAIKGGQAEPFVIGRTSMDNSYVDQDVTVDSRESVFRFSNGVVVKHCTEADSIENSELLCPECWISYEVLSAPEGLDVRPGHKTFISQCQETFWLKMAQNHLGRG